MGGRRAARIILQHAPLGTQRRAIIMELLPVTLSFWPLLPPPILMRLRQLLVVVILFLLGHHTVPFHLIMTASSMDGPRVAKMRRCNVLKSSRLVTFLLPQWPHPQVQNKRLQAVRPQRIAGRYHWSLMDHCRRRCLWLSS